MAGRVANWKISTNKRKVKGLGSPLRAEPSKTNSRYSICKRQTANERGGGERYETIFNIGDEPRVKVKLQKRA